MRHETGVMRHDDYLRVVLLQQSESHATGHGTVFRSYYVSMISLDVTYDNFMKS